MSRDLDTRARQAAAGLKAVMEKAELTSTPPMAPTPKRGMFVAGLRPALVVGLLAIGSAVGVALMLDSTPAPPATTTTIAVTTTQAPVTTTVPAGPTTIFVAPVAPVTTTTVAPDLEPPDLVITSPENGAHFSEKTITFAGITEPGARVFAGKYEADVDSEGNWSIVLILSEGANKASFTARDEAGNESEASVTVFYDVETTTTTVNELAKFTAEATYGSCSLTPPYDVYHGTGEPGSLVTITSEYGSGSVEVGLEGGWEKQVFFETAPPNVTFVVTVIDEFGRQAQFEFVYLPT